MTVPSPKIRKRDAEDGYILVAVIFMMALLILSLAIAVPKVREDIQRDRDEETMHRGKQYIRAVQLYYRKFNTYPPNIDALVKTNDIRCLRKKYIDPTTGKEEWKPVLFGQNKTPQAMGFFGQPLAAAIGGGIGPGGGNTGLNGTAGGIGAGSGIGSTATGGAFGSSTTAPTDSGTTTATGQTGTTGTDGTATQAGGSTTGAAGTGSAFGSSSNPTGTGQSFGGGGIIGFSPQSPKQSIIVYKKKNHYIDWEFLYSPQMDQQTVGGGNTGTIGQPASGTTTGIGTNPVGGSGGSPGTTTTTPAPPTTPTPTSPN